MTLSLGYLTPKQKTIWDLKNSGLQEAHIAHKLNVTRQTVHKSLDTANLKIGEALQEVAKINKIDIQTVNAQRGFLKGYSNHFKTPIFITFTAKNGIQVWYKHEGNCEKCSKLQTCQDTLLAEAKDRNFLLLDDTSKILPSKLAEALFAKITGKKMKNILKRIKNWCPQPEIPLTTKLRRHSMPVAAVLTVALIFSLLLNGAVAASNDDWSMFRYDSAHTGTTTSAGPVQPDLLWSYIEGHFDGSFIGSSAAVVNGIVYVGSNHDPVEQRGGNVYAFNAYTGDKIWNYSTNSAIHSSPAVSESILYIGADNSVYALNASTGSKLWSYPTGNGINSSPNVVNGVVYIGSNDNNVYALDSSTGDKLWNYTTDGGVASSPAVENGVVYVGSNDGNVYALDAVTGVKIWNYTTSNQPFYEGEQTNRVTSSPAVSDGVVYVGSVGGNIYALNASTGDKIWNYFTNPTFYYGGGYFGGVQASPAVANGVVFIGAVGGNVPAIVYALDASAGNQLWNYSVSGINTRILSSAAVSNGVVYLGISNVVYAINASTGSQIWDFPTQNQINSSPTVFNGTVYIGSQDGNFYAIGKQSTTSPSPFSPILLFAIVIAVVAAVVIAIGFLLLFHKRSKAKMTNPSRLWYPNLAEDSIKRITGDA
jgi:outer membrane protein assembly factor BamB